MLKLTIAVLAVALAGTASAAGWRSLRLDGSSEASFEKSLAELREKLTNGRRYAFTLALHDIWQEGTKNAEAKQHEYTEADYRRQLDGLGYEDVVRLTDPTGQTARRYRAAYNPYAAGDARQRVAMSAGPRDTWSQIVRTPVGPNEQLHGSPDPLPMK
jgi:hypothetical protein